MIPKIRIFTIYWLPLIGYCVFIYIQSSYPSPERLPSFNYSDKLLHFGAYAVMGILFYRAYTACQSGEIPEEVIVVGAGVLSLGLALAFIVSRQPFRRIGQSLKEEIVELPGSGSTRNWSDYAKEDQQVNQLLGLKGYSFSWLREGVAFLAPIIGAVIPLLLKP